MIRVPITRNYSKVACVFLFPLQQITAIATWIIRRLYARNYLILKWAVSKLGTERLQENGRPSTLTSSQHLRIYM
ncbi:unnamed protein product [Hermetia illucens]|uniref:Uncharacterized protein n=1 Tax=Hermetia illucens TaxID=343691 RepID=A0A7R8YTW0_HERIL|nr:unnamed protein product [Hermetia illucens]